MSRIAALIATLFLTFVGAPTLAGSCGNFPFNGLFSQFRIFNVSEGDTVTIEVDPISTITFTGAFFSYWGEYIGNSPFSSPVNIPSDGPLHYTYVVPAGVHTVELDHTGLLFTGEVLYLSVTCTPAFAANPVSDTAGMAGGSNQNAAVSKALSFNARNRLNGGESRPQVTQNSVFLSTQNLQDADMFSDGFSAWIAAEARRLTGATTGSGLDLAFGVDRVLSENALAGIFIAYGRSNITRATDSASSTSPMIGGYFASRNDQGAIFDGYLGFARPTYQTAGTSFNAQRVSATLSFKGAVSGKYPGLQSYFRLKGFSESQPAYVGTGGAVLADTITSFDASFGGQWTSAAPINGIGLVPYLRLAFQYGFRKSNANGVSNFISPNIGFGFSGPVAGGQINLDVEGTKATSSTISISLLLSFSRQF